MKLAKGAKHTKKETDPAALHAQSHRLAGVKPASSRSRSLRDIRDTVPICESS